MKLKPCLTLNILIVKHDATYVAWQADSWRKAQEEVCRKKDDPWYEVKGSDPVFISDGKRRVQHSVDDFIAYGSTYGDDESE